MTRIKLLRALSALLLAAWVTLVPTSLLADWRKDIGIFRIGIVSRLAPDVLIANVEPFRLALAENLRLDVEVFPLGNTAELVDALIAGRIEYAVMSASAYGLASSACECVEPLVIPMAADSTSTYRMVAVAAPGTSGGVEAVSSNPVYRSSQRTISGYVLPYKLLSEESIDFAALRPAGEFSTMEEALIAFAKAETGVLFGWSTMTGDASEGYTRGSLRDIAALRGGDITGYRVIWQSPQIPHHPHVVRKSLDGEAKRLLRDLLVSLFESDPLAYDAIEPEFGGGFTIARQGQFEPLVELFGSGIVEQLSERKSPLPN